MEAAYYRPDARREIWAYGLRNPWQFSFDRETGDLCIADVRQVTWEEINLESGGSARGLNYGWDCLEGGNCYPADVETCPREQVGSLPVAEYVHGEDGCSITGIGINRGEEFASLDGVYFNSDWCSGKVWGLAEEDGGDWVCQELLDTELNITGAGEDADGNLCATVRAYEFSRRYDAFEDPQ